MASFGGRCRTGRARLGERVVDDLQERHDGAMDALLVQLSERGVLDASSAAWAERHAFERRIPVDVALLDLELLDEESLLKCLGEWHQRPAATPATLRAIDPALAEQIPLGFSRAFDLCPVAVADGRLSVLVTGALTSASLNELRGLFAVEPRQLVAPSFYLEVARACVYGTEVSRFVQELAPRLDEHRAASDVSVALRGIEQAPSFSAAAAMALEFAMSRVEFACLLSARSDALRVSATRDGEPAAGSLLELPDPSCTLSAAIRHGGYFFGPLAGNEADGRLFGSLCRTLPEWAFVAPIHTPGRVAAVMVADNGGRGIAQRWVAELALVLARLGQRATQMLEQNVPRIGGEREAVSVPPPASDPSTLDEVEPGTSPAAELESREQRQEEERVIERLRREAGMRGLALEDFVDRLLLLDATRGERRVGSQRPGVEEPAPLQLLAAEPVAPGPLLAAEPNAPPFSGSGSDPIPDPTSPSTAVSERVSPVVAESPPVVADAASLPGAAVTPPASATKPGAETAVAPPVGEPATATPATGREMDMSAALVGEFRGLFEKLATDIPAHFARGMEAAFRDLAPRIAAPTPASAASTAEAPAARAAAAAATLEFKQEPQAPREVADYRSRRQKSRRVKF